MSNVYDQFDPPPAEPRARTRVTVDPGRPETPPTNVYDQFDGDSPLGVVKAGGTGIAKGVIGALGAPADIRDLLKKGVSFAAEKLGASPETSASAGDIVGRAAISAVMPGAALVPDKVPTSAELRQGIESVTGEFYKSQGPIEKATETLGEFVPAAFAGPGGIARKLLTGAVAPAAAVEGVGRIPGVEGSPLEPWIKAGAAVAAGGGAMALTRPSTPARALGRQMPDYVTPAHVQDARALMQDAVQRGVNLTWPEALSQVTGRPVLSDMMRILESSPQSRTRMQNFYADRPQQVEGAVRGELAGIAPPTTNPSTIGGAVGQAAEGAVNDVRGAINNAANPFYRGSENVLLTTAEMAPVQALPGFASAVRAVRRDPQLNRTVGHLPVNSIGFLNEVKKYLDQAATNARSPLNQNPNMQRAAGLGSDATAVRDAATNAAGDVARQYGTALAVESVGRERFLNPLLRGPLGTLADRDITTRKAINALFPTSPIAGSEHEISTAVSAVARRNPSAATQLVRAHAESTFNDAATALQGGMSQFTGAKFSVRIAGNPQQRANLQAAVESLPHGGARWAGFERLLDIVEATGTRQAKGSLTAFNAQELAAMTGGGTISGTIRTATSPGKWASLVDKAWGNWQRGRNLDNLARILTDPHSAPLLQRLATLPPDSNAALVAAARLIMIGDISRKKTADSPNQ